MLYNTKYSQYDFVELPVNVVIMFQNFVCFNLYVKLTEVRGGKVRI
jgi:hypothetical protein